MDVDGTVYNKLCVHSFSYYLIHLATDERTDGQTVT